VSQSVHWTMKTLCSEHTTQLHHSGAALHVTYSFTKRVPIDYYSPKTVYTLASTFWNHNKTYSHFQHYFRYMF
jgi:hypothetical protein